VPTASPLLSSPPGTVGAWRTADRVLRWPSAAARFRDEWVPQADWVELDGIGHCPQLDVPLETAQLIGDFTREPVAS